MSNTPDKANIERLKKISQKIGAIFKNCENGIDEALMDEDTLQAAIMMKFINIYAPDARHTREQRPCVSCFI